MSHNDVHKLFVSTMPHYAGGKVEAWFPNGKNSIRVRHHNKKEYAFTCNGPDDWKFETIKSFMKTM